MSILSFRITVVSHQLDFDPSGLISVAITYLNIGFKLLFVNLTPVSLCVYTHKSSEIYENRYMIFRQLISDGKRTSTLGSLCV